MHDNKTIRTDQLYPIEANQLNYKNIIKHRFYGLCQLFPLLSEVNLLKEALGHFCVIASGYGEIAVLTHMRQVIDHLTNNLFRNTERDFNELLEKGNLLDELIQMMMVSLPETLVDQLTGDDARNVLADILDDILFELHSLKNQFSTLTVDYDIQLKEKQQYLKESKDNFIHCVLELYELQSLRTGISKENILLELAKVNKMYAHASNEDPQDTAVSFKARFRINSIIEKYQSLCPERYDRYAFYFTLSSILEGSPIIFRNEQSTNTVTTDSDADVIRSGREFNIYFHPMLKAAYLE